MKKSKLAVEHRVLPQRNRKPPTLYPIAPLPIKVEDDQLREKSQQLQNHRLKIIHSEFDLDLLSFNKKKVKPKTKGNALGFKKLKGADLKAINSSVLKSEQIESNSTLIDLGQEPNFEQYHHSLLKRERQYFKREQELTKYAKAQQKLAQNYQTVTVPFKRLKRSHTHHHRPKETKEITSKEASDLKPKVFDHFILNDASTVRQVLRPKVMRPFLADTLYSPYITPSMKQYISKTKAFDLTKFEWYSDFVKSRSHLNTTQ